MGSVLRCRVGLVEMEETITFCERRLHTQAAIQQQPDWPWPDTTKRLDADD